LDGFDINNIFLARFPELSLYYFVDFVPDNILSTFYL